MKSKFIVLFFYHIVLQSNNFSFALVRVTRDKVNQDTGKLADFCIFIEPADSTLELLNSFSPNEEKNIVTGQFYIRKDYPKGYLETEEEVEKAKVFQYTKLKIIKKEGWEITK